MWSKLFSLVIWETTHCLIFGILWIQKHVLTIYIILYTFSHICHICFSFQCSLIQPHTCWILVIVGHSYIDLLCFFRVWAFCVCGVCLYVQVYTCLWGQRMKPNVIFNCSPPYFWNKAFHWTWSSLIRLGRQASELQGISCVCFPDARIIAMYHCTGFFCEY